VWSSMKLPTTELVMDYLFHGNKGPFKVLGQEQCRQIETSRNEFLHIDRKPVFLKILSEWVFPLAPDGDNAITVENTLLINNSPDKGVCNEKGNGLLLRKWRHG